MPTGQHISTRAARIRSSVHPLEISLILSSFLPCAFCVIVLLSAPLLSFADPRFLPLLNLLRAFLTGPFVLPILPRLWRRAFDRTIREAEDKEEREEAKEERGHKK